MTQSLDESVGRVLAKLQARHRRPHRLHLHFRQRRLHRQRQRHDRPGQWPALLRRNWRLHRQRGDKAVTDNYPLRSGKGSLYEGGVRVPLIVRWPGVTPAAACAASRSSRPTSIRRCWKSWASRATPSTTESRWQEHRRAAQASGGHVGREALFFHYPRYHQTTTPSVRSRATRLETARILRGQPPGAVQPGRRSEW